MSKGEDAQRLTKQEQYYHTKSVESENGGIEYHQQYQTILNLYHSGIPTYIYSVYHKIRSSGFGLGFPIDTSGTI